MERLTSIWGDIDGEKLYSTGEKLVKIMTEMQKTGEFPNQNAISFFAKQRLKHLVEKKLGQLEDIEEELGIDLITFVKLNKTDKIYDKEEENFMYYDYIDFENKRLVCVDDFDEMSCSHLEYYYYFKDYGKKWALTKEELKEE